MSGPALRTYNIPNLAEIDVLFDVAVASALTGHIAIGTTAGHTLTINLASCPPPISQVQFAEWFYTQLIAQNTITAMTFAYDGNEIVTLALAGDSFSSILDTSASLTEIFQWQANGVPIPGGGGLQPGQSVPPGFPGIQGQPTERPVVTTLFYIANQDFSYGGDNFYKGQSYSFNPADATALLTQNLVTKSKNQSV